MAPKESGTIRRVDLLGVDVGLVEEGCHHGVRLWGFVSELLTPSDTIHFLLPARCETLNCLSSTISACTPLCPTIIIMKWPSEL